MTFPFLVKQCTTHGHAILKRILVPGLAGTSVHLSHNLFSFWVLFYILCNKTQEKWGRKKKRICKLQFTFFFFWGQLQLTVEKDNTNGPIKPALLVLILKNKKPALLESKGICESPCVVDQKHPPML